MRTASVGSPRVWYFLIKLMTEVNKSTYTSSAEERDSGRSPPRSLWGDGQKRASSSDVEGAGSTGARSFARVAGEPTLTRRESEVSCGRIVESASRDSQVSWGGGGSFFLVVSPYLRTLKTTTEPAHPGSGWSCVSCRGC